MNKKLYMAINWVGSIILLVIGVFVASQFIFADFTFAKTFVNSLFAFACFVLSVRFGYVALSLFLNTEDENYLKKISIRDIEIK